MSQRGNDLLTPFVPQPPPRQRGGCWVSFVGCPISFFWSQSFSLSFFHLWLVGIRGAVEKGTGGQDLGIDLGFGAAAHFLVSLFFFCFSSFSSELLPSLLQLYSFRF